MEKVHLKEIARLTGTSPSTVSRVLNHCGGVDSLTRDRVFRAADALRFPGQEGTGCDLYFITPELPAFFWKERLYPELLAAEQRFRCKYNVYTGLHDGSVLRYLEEAERLQARVVVAVCTPTSAERAALEALAERALVILLSEYAEVKNAFYVGSDPERDGFLLGRFFAGQGGGQPAALTCPDNENCRARVRGFRSGAGTDRITELPLPPFGKMFPARTAALLHGLPGTGRYWLYSAAGLPDELALAVRKAGLVGKAVLLGHDLRRPDPQRNVLACVNQRIEEQARTALSLAAEYLARGLCPAEKRTIVPSEFLCAGSGCGERTKTDLPPVPDGGPG